MCSRNQLVALAQAWCPTDSGTCGPSLLVVLGAPCSWKVPASPIVCLCHRAGVKAGDVVLEINGQASRRAEDVYEAVRTQQSLTLLLRRGHDTLLLSVIPEATE